MNASTFNDKPRENTISNWLLPCTWNTQRCHCNSRFRPDILCVKGLPYQSDSPIEINPNLTIQFIEFTHTNDRFSPEAIGRKIIKYLPLIHDITNHGWKVDPILIITAGARGTTHIPPMQQLVKTFKLYETSIKRTFKAINTIAIQHAGSILLHKRRIENNQPIPTE